MRELDTQIRDYFEEMAPRFEVGDLVRDRDTTIIELTPKRERRHIPWAAVAAAVLTLVAVGLLPWLLRGGNRDVAPAATRGTLEVGADTVLDADHIGTVVVAADGVTLDCDGHTVAAPPGGLPTGPAINVQGGRDIIVRNCVIRGFEYGITVSRSEDVVVEHNAIEAIIGGIGIGDSARVEIAHNTVTGASVDGYLFQTMRNSVVRDNAGTDNLVHFSFEFDSTDNTVESNDTTGGSTGIELVDASGNMFRNNTVSGAASWGINDLSGGVSGRILNQYEDNRCTGAPSRPAGVCGP